MEKINLISDTVTKPTSGMLDYMIKAEVGDDVFRQDPTVNTLEEKAANLFGKEAGLFCPSGTMTNQIAIKCHTEPLDEVICDHYSHVYQYETGGYAFNSGVAIKLIHGENGKIKPHQIKEAINPDFDWLPNSKLVVIENTCNKGGGTIYTLREMAAISNICYEENLRLHLDGARIFNALVETRDATQEVGALFDSISICLSKGLGAPVGSLLLGDQSFIKKARKFRKVLGGGMRQAGYLAAAGIYALDHHVERLKQDNNRARRVGKILNNLPFVESIRPVQSNILIFDLKSPWTTDKFLQILAEKGIMAVPFGPKTIRFTFHLDLEEKHIRRIIRELKKIN
jgi:threonine aldolase